MDTARVIYWMAHWICHKIEEIKVSSKETTTVEQIAWSLVDRWE